MKLVIKTLRKVRKKFIEVGKFNKQAFGFFVSPTKSCPIVNSPYGYLIGKKQNFFMDDANYRYGKRSGTAPVFRNAEGSVWTVCEYDPNDAVETVENS